MLTASVLERIQGNWVRTIIVETANRFARDPMVQGFGHAVLRGRGIDLIAADKHTSFLDDTPTAKLVRQVLGAIAEFDKAMTVAKLRGARERKRRDEGKCEGRKSHAEQNPELVALAKRLRRQKPKRRAYVAACDLGRTGCARPFERERPAIRSGVHRVHAGRLTGVAALFGPHASRRGVS